MTMGHTYQQVHLPEMQHGQDRTPCSCEGTAASVRAAPRCFTAPLLRECSIMLTLSCLLTLFSPRALLMGSLIADPMLLILC